MDMKYVVVIEQTESGCSAYVPDLPGCVAAASSHDEIVELIREAIEFHIEGLIEDGDPVPEPTSVAAVVEVQAA